MAEDEVKAQGWRCRRCDKSIPIPSYCKECWAVIKPARVHLTPDSNVAVNAGKEVARELNGGDRSDCSYPKELVALLDDPSISNEAALATWVAAIVSRHLNASPGFREGVEAAAERAFKAVMSVEKSENHYAAPQKAASVAANVRALLFAGYQEDTGR